MKGGAEPAPWSARPRHRRHHGQLFTRSADWCAQQIQQPLANGARYAHGRAVAHGWLSSRSLGWFLPVGAISTDVGSGMRFACPTPSSAFRSAKWPLLFWPHAGRSLVTSHRMCGQNQWVHTDDIGCNEARIDQAGLPVRDWYPLGLHPGAIRVQGEQPAASSGCRVGDPARRRQDSAVPPREAGAAGQAAHVAPRVPSLTVRTTLLLRSVCLRPTGGSEPAGAAGNL